MDLTNMPIKLFLKKLTLETDLREEQRFNDLMASDARKMEEFKRIEKIWNYINRIEGIKE